MIIRPAYREDLAGIMEVLEAARGIMRASGNMDQWTGGYPSEELILSDIAQGYGFVVLADDISAATTSGAIAPTTTALTTPASPSAATLSAYFAFVPSPEPTYAEIFGGKWLDDSLPYHAVHRLGSLPLVHGVFRAVMDWCFCMDSNIRIDTHRDNHIMRHCIERYGFSYCGIIYLESGDERLAYQRLKAPF